MNESRVYFPNLNGLRFIAAFLVIIHHTEQLKTVMQMNSLYGKLPFIDIIGKLGVILFFVLSGFLITYLLITEESKFKSISVKNFYVRRILRIWPLYFLIIFLSFVIFPNIPFFNLPGYDKDIIYSKLFLKILFYAFFFPNLALVLLGIVPYASHTWSIGTEEQYYLIWPVLIKYIKKYRIALMLFIIIFYLLIDWFLMSPYSDVIPYKLVFKLFWKTFNIDSMAIGGIFAIVYYQKSKLLVYLQNKYLFNLVIILVLTLIVNGIYIPYFHYEAYSVLFAVIILNFATNKNLKITLENRLFNYFGKISYGLYMYHPIGIIIAIKLCISISYDTNLVIYPLCFIITIILSSLSYRYYESYFLKFKQRFSNIDSGNI